MMQNSKSKKFCIPYTSTQL